MRRPTSLRGMCLCVLLTVMCAVSARAQEPPPPGNGPGDGPPGPMERHRPPMERAFRMGPPGRWWNNPSFVKDLGLTQPQQQQMDKIFEQSRPELINLSTVVRNQEAAMEPLLSVDHPDQTKVLAQIDRVAQARAELEKANARMLLGLRQVLTKEQWQKLEAEDPRQHLREERPEGPPPPQQ